MMISIRIRLNAECSDEFIAYAIERITRFVRRTFGLHSGMSSPVVVTVKREDA